MLFVNKHAHYKLELLLSHESITSNHKGAQESNRHAWILIIHRNIYLQISQKYTHFQDCFRIQVSVGHCSASQEPCQDHTILCYGSNLEILYKEKVVVCI